jgi:CRP-like cAMP-binding protein
MEQGCCRLADSFSAARRGAGCAILGDSMAHEALPPTSAGPAATGDGYTGLLRRVPLFATLAPEQLETVAARMRRRSFRRGEVVFHRGDPAGPLHVICAGTVKVTAPTAEGDEAVLAMYGAGVCFGEIAALDGGPRSATVTALEPTETLSLQPDDLLSCVREYPDLAQHVIVVFAARLRRTSVWLEDAYFHDLDTRLARRLRELAQERGQPTAQGIVVAFPLTQTELAGMLGATRATVNQLLGLYQDTGLLRLGKRTFTILRPADLERRAGLE